jgi:Undecaprenyl-phosphate galactose phosphotransferase WbaP
VYRVNQTRRTPRRYRQQCFIKDSFVASPSQLIQPLISTGAISTLAHTVPGKSDTWETTEHLPTLANSFSRYLQVVVTSIPLVLADLLAIAVSYLTATIVIYSYYGAQYYSGLWNNVLAVCACHLLVGTFLGLFPASGINPVRELRSQLSSIGGSFLLLVTLNGLVGEVTKIELLVIAIAYPLTVLAGPIARFGVRRICGSFTWWGENVIIVGGGEQGRHVHQFLARIPQRGLKPLGVVDDNPSLYWSGERTDNVDFLGTTADIVRLCRQRDCHWIIAAVADKSDSERQQILTRASLIPNLVILNSSLMLPAMWVESFDAAGLTGIHIRDSLMFPFKRMSKRVFDILMAAGILACCSPIIFAIGVWIKLNSSGPIFYRHHGRIGRGGVRFGALKIRTMVNNSEAILKDYLATHPDAMEEWRRDLKLRNDPRIIPGIGSFLRRTSLDELPQLWNVIVGDMSLVGPRPIVTDEVEKYQEVYPLYERVRPGMTGLWQVSGRNNTSYEDRVRLDHYYIRNWSLWFDYFILLRTFRTVVMREGSC